LYEKDDFETRPLFTLEEIYRTDLSEVVLRMAELGIDDFESFDFISSPGRQGIIGAVETLELLEALTPEYALSEIGKMMAVFPLLPRHSRIIVEAIRAYPDVLEEAVIATAFLTTNTPFLLPQGEEMEARRAHHQYQDVMGDFVSYLKLFHAYTSADAKDKEKFCERRYLDPRAMAEIKNVVDQLSEIVGSMGVPVSSGGSVADYLCAVSKGLIQFICVRSGRNAYRSVTAEKVMIHPSSVMFRETPRFIVAGEIVRTTRMYARSVSPLEKEWLPRISPALARTLIEPAGEPAAKKERDTTWQIKIGTKFFKLQQYKGKKKIAVLPWEDLEDLLRSSSIALLPQHNNIRGKVVYQNYELLSGTRLSTIMKIVPHVNIRTDVIESWPRKKTYDVTGPRPELCLNLGIILKLSRIKKSSRALGFLALHSDNAGLYWFKPMRDFHAAASESLATIERLVDDLADDTDQSIIDLVNEQYRRLAQILENA
ncbi:MAG: ATP-dependent RNA helicase, partial [Spirochaetaceae bacterium]